MHLNGTSGGYQSDNLKRVTAVIVATRHKQLYTYVRILYKELENINPRECVSAGFFLRTWVYKISVTGHRHILMIKIVSISRGPEGA